MYRGVSWYVNNAPKCAPATTAMIQSFISCTETPKKQLIITSTLHAPIQRYHFVPSVGLNSRISWCKMWSRFAQVVLLYLGGNGNTPPTTHPLIGPKSKKRGVGPGFFFSAPLCCSLILVVLIIFFETSLLFNFCVRRTYSATVIS